MHALKRGTLPQAFALIVLCTAVACGGSEECSTCPRPPSTVPSVAGVWRVTATTSNSGTFGSYFSSEDLVAELHQHGTKISGRIGGNSHFCVTSPITSCVDDVIRGSAVDGEIHADSTLILQWLDDTTRIVRQGWLGRAGLEGLIADLGVWEAGRVTPRPIAEAPGVNGNTITVRGVVTVRKGLYAPGDVAYVQDATAGILVIGLPDSLRLLEGDSVLLRGLSGQDAYDELAIVPASSVEPPVTVRLGAGRVPAPRSVTPAEVASRSYEGSLAVVRGVRLVSSQTYSDGFYTLTFADSDAVAFQAVVHPSVAVSMSAASWSVGATYDVTGILGSTDGSPFLQPRRAADRVPR